MDQFEGMAAFRAANPAYVRTRESPVCFLLLTNTKLAIEEVYTHCTEMPRLNEKDLNFHERLGMGSYVPCLLLMQGKDQACYNLLRWRHVGRDETVDFHHESAMEPVHDFLHPRVPLAELAALTLLKVRLLIDMRNKHLRQTHASTTPEKYISDITATHHA